MVGRNPAQPHEPTTQTATADLSHARAGRFVETVMCEGLIASSGAD